MTDLGLSSTQMRRYLQLLTSDHQQRTRVALLDLDHTYLESFTGIFEDGQLELDATDETSPVFWTAQVVLLDSTGRVDLDSRSPVEGQAYLDRMIQVHVDVWDPDVQDWIPAPVFCGPVTGVKRDGETITVDCQDKGILGQGAAWTTKVFPKGRNVVAVIREILQLAGETRFLFPSGTKGELADRVTLTRSSKPLEESKKLAKARGWQVFYDGRGFARLRRRASARIVHTFNDRWVASRPTVNFNTTDVINAWHITGGTPKGAKKKVEAWATLDQSHPWAPHRLGRGGKGRHLLEEVEDDTLTSQKKVDEYAAKKKKTAGKQEADVTFECCPIYHLDPHDMCRLEKDLSVAFRFRKATIPLRGNALMTVGYIRRGTPSRYRRARLRKGRR